MVERVDPRLRNLNGRTDPRLRTAQQRVQNLRQVQAQQMQDRAIKQEAQRLDNEFKDVKGNINEIKQVYNSIPESVRKQMTFSIQNLESRQNELKSNIQREIDKAKEDIENTRRREDRERDKKNPNIKRIDRFRAQENEYQEQIRAYNEALTEVNKGNILDLNNVRKYARDVGNVEYRKSLGSFIQKEAQKAADQFKSVGDNKFSVKINNITYTGSREFIERRLNKEQEQKLRKLESEAGKGQTVKQLFDKGYSAEEIGVIGQFESNLQKVQENQNTFNKLLKQAETANKSEVNKFRFNELESKGLTPTQIQAIQSTFETGGYAETYKDLDTEKFFKAQLSKAQGGRGLTTTDVANIQAFKVVTNQAAKELNFKPLEFTASVSDYQKLADKINTTIRKAQGEFTQAETRELAQLIKPSEQEALLRKELTGQTLTPNDIAKLNQMSAATGSTITKQQLKTILTTAIAPLPTLALRYKNEPKLFKQDYNNIKNISISTGKFSVGVTKELGNIVKEFAVLLARLGIKGTNTVFSKARKELVLMTSLATLTPSQRMSAATSIKADLQKDIDKSVNNTIKAGKGVFDAAKWIKDNPKTAVSTLLISSLIGGATVFNLARTGSVALLQKAKENPERAVAEAIFLLMPVSWVSNSARVTANTIRTKLLTKKNLEIIENAIKSLNQIPKKSIAQLKQLSELNKITQTNTKLKSLADESLKISKNINPNNKQTQSVRLSTINLDFQDLVKNIKDVDKIVPKISQVKDRLTKVEKDNLKKFISTRNNIRNQITRVDNRIKNKNTSEIEKTILLTRLNNLKKFNESITKRQNDISNNLSLSKKEKSQLFKDLTLDIKKTEKLEILYKQLNEIQTKLKSQGYKDLNTLPPNIRDKFVKVFSELNNLQSKTLNQIGSLLTKVKNLKKIKLPKQVDINKSKLVKVERDIINTARKEIARQDKFLKKENLDNVLSKPNAKRVIEERIVNVEKQIVNLRKKFLSNVFLIEDFKDIPLLDSKKYLDFLKELFKTQNISRSERVRLSKQEGFINDLEKRIKQLRSNIKNIPTKKELDQKLFMERLKKSQLKTKQNIIVNNRDIVIPFKVLDIEGKIFITNVATARKGKWDKKAMARGIQLPKVRVELNKSTIKKYGSNPDKTFKNFDKALNNSRLYKQNTNQYLKTQRLNLKAQRKIDLAKDPIMKRKLKKAQTQLNDQITKQTDLLDDILKRIIELTFKSSIKQLSKKDIKLSQDLQRRLQKVNDNINKLDNIYDAAITRIEKTTPKKPTNTKPPRTPRVPKSPKPPKRPQPPKKPPKRPQPPKKPPKRPQPPKKPPKIRLPSWKKLKRDNSRRVGYIIRVKEGNRIVAQSEELLPFNRAKKVGGRIVDKNISASFDVVKAGTTNIIDLKENPKVMKKFTKRKGKDPKVRIFVEKPKFRLDKPTEKKQIKQARKKKAKKQSQTKKSNKKSKKVTKNTTKKKKSSKNRSKKK